MDADDKDFNKYIEEYMKDYLKEIAEDCKRIYKEKIQELVYNAYSPTEYERTYQLLDSVDIKYEKGAIYIFNNTEKTQYHSAVSGEEVSKYIPMFVNSGHSDDTGIDNMYHNYPARNYLQEIKREIDKKYGIDIEIIDDWITYTW